MSEIPSRKDSFWSRIIFIISLAVISVVAFLILGARPEGFDETINVSGLPAINATLNAITTILLISACFLIKRKKKKYHKNVMLAAFGTSALFFMSYVVYHWFKSGPKHYTGDWTTLYFIILFSHILLAAVIVPLALMTLYRGWTNRIEKHRKLAVITLPIWLYVSITGVIIYRMLY